MVFPMGQAAQNAVLQWRWHSASQPAFEIIEVKFNPQ
jgi:hypothetical protein